MKRSSQRAKASALSARRVADARELLDEVIGEPREDLARVQARVALIIVSPNMQRMERRVKVRARCELAGIAPEPRVVVEAPLAASEMITDPKKYRMSKRPCIQAIYWH